MRHPVNRHNIERDTGVFFCPRSSNHALEPFECHSWGTVKSLCRLHGHDHIVQVLKSIVATPHNADQLYKATILGVSGFYIEGRYEGQDLAIASEVINYVDLGRLLKQVREANLKHMSVRFADRLIVMTQEVA